MAINVKKTKSALDQIADLKLDYELRIAELENRMKQLESRFTETPA